MKILLASSELHPYSKSGGLADMVGALAKSLAVLGNEVGVITPLYRGIRAKFPALKKFDWQLDLLLGTERATAEVWTLNPSANLTIYFIDHLPVATEPADIAWIVLASVITAGLATLYPAIQASRLYPIDAIRHE